MRQRRTRHSGMLRAIVHPPIVLFPRHLAGVTDEVLARDVVVLPDFRARIREKNDSAQLVQAPSSE
jgi:hypothetical protein